MRVEILYLEGCPHVPPTIARLESIGVQLGIPLEVSLSRIDTAADAQSRRFPGSPTVRVEGTDIEHGVETRQLYGLCCRTYAGQGVPREEMIREALLRARQIQRDT